VKDFLLDYRLHFAIMTIAFVWYLVRRDHWKGGM
jgi:hypothetical protein